MHQLLWILFAAIIGFAVPFLFGNLTWLPVDLYYLIYFISISAFFTLYVRVTHLDLRKLVTVNTLFGIILGLLFAFIMAKNILSRPETPKLASDIFVWALFWRGLVYGAVDGMFLSVFPYVVTWRTFDVDGKPLLTKLGFMALAWIFMLIITTAYHAGYKDFRSKKIIQPNIGNTIMSVPSFLSGNPCASAITHAGMHIAAVIHSPGTDLFLPPHR